MKVLLTGIPGTGYHEVLDQLKHRLGRKLDVYRVGRDLLQTASAQKLPITQERVLDTEETTLRALRSSVFNTLLRRLASSANNSIVQTHASFRWRKTLRPAFDWSLVKRLDPDVLVNLTDNWQEIWAWMQREPQWRDELALSEVLFWREEEFLITRLMADELARDFVLVPRVEAVNVLYDLIVHPSASRIYLSHPMTGAKGGVRAFAKELGKLFMVFDPASLSDLEFGKVANRINTQHGKVRVVLSARERSFLDEVLRGQITRVDYQFIDQSRITLAYYFAGSPTSAGVQSEMQYATGTNKDVFALWLKKGNPSPFVRQYSARFFQRKDDVLGFLRKKYARK